MGHCDIYATPSDSEGCQGKRFRLTGVDGVIRANNLLLDQTVAKERRFGNPMAYLITWSKVD
jgi:hypothetical protein